MKIYFVTNMYEKMPFASDFIFYETNFENSKKTGKHCKYFSFYKNFMSKQRIPLSKKILPFSPTPSYLEKNFFPTLIVKLEEVNLPAPL